MITKHYFKLDLRTERNCQTTNQHTNNNITIGVSYFEIVANGCLSIGLVVAILKTD